MEEDAAALPPVLEDSSLFLKPLRWSRRERGLELRSLGLERDARPPLPDKQLASFIGPHRISALFFCRKAGSCKRSLCMHPCETCLPAFSTMNIEKLIIRKLESMFYHLQTYHILIHPPSLSLSLSYTHTHTYTNKHNTNIQQSGQSWYLPHVHFQHTHTTHINKQYSLSI